MGDTHAPIVRGADSCSPTAKVPPPIRKAYDTVTPEPILMERFRALTEGPIIFHYGDDILSEPTNLPAQD